MNPHNRPYQPILETDRLAVLTRLTNDGAELKRRVGVHCKNIDGFRDEVIAKLRALREADRDVA